MAKHCEYEQQLRHLKVTLDEMQDIIDKYGIENNRKMFCCPFHNDRHPSAKIYKNS